MKKQFFALNYLFPRLEDLIYVLVLTGGLVLGPRMLGIDSDLGRHLALGQYMLEGNPIPNTDILSHTKPGESRPPYEWGAQVLFALFNKIAGLNGVIFVTSLVLACTFFILYRQTSGNLPLLALIFNVIAIAGTSIHWLPRPHIFTFLFLLIWVAKLEREDGTDARSAYRFALIMLVWANLHGGFIFGFLTWFAYLAGELWEHLVKKNLNTQIMNLFKIGAWSLAASMITPDGWGSWHAIAGNNSRYILSNTVETMTPDFYRPETWPFLILLVFVIVIPMLTHASVRTGRIFLIGGMAIAGLQMARNTPLFALVSVPYLIDATRPLLDRFETWKRVETNFANLHSQLRLRLWPVALTICMGIMTIFQVPPFHSERNRFNRSAFPSGAVDWLASHPQTGNMFNEFNWGGYLEFRLWPQYRVFLDSQTDFYGEPLMREYQSVVSAGPGWDGVIEKYSVQWMIISVKSPLTVELSDSPGWVLLYQDGTTVIFRRRK